VKWDGNILDDKKFSISTNHRVLVVTENICSSRKLSETGIRSSRELSLDGKSST